MAINLEAYSIMGKDPTYSLVNKADKLEVFRATGKNSVDALGKLAESYWTYKLQHPEIDMSLNYKGKNLSGTEQTSFEVLLREGFQTVKNKLESEGKLESKLPVLVGVDHDLGFWNTPFAWNYSNNSNSALQKYNVYENITEITRALNSLNASDLEALANMRGGNASSWNTTFVPGGK